MPPVPKVRTLLARKIGMTQLYDDQGQANSASILKAGPCWVLQVKNQATDGYDAIQLGFEHRPEKNLNKAQVGHFKKAGATNVSFIREVRLAKPDGFKAGDVLRVGEVFGDGDYVDVLGISKGKGFAGGVKRWGFHGGPKTHGQSDRHRAPGSLAGRRSLGRVLPGKKMAGHLGSDAVAVMKLEVLRVDPQSDLLYVKGAVPGHNGGFLVVRETLRKRKKKLVVLATKVSKKKQVVKAASKK